MYHLTRHGHPISKPHPHRVTCYIEALERGLVAKSGRQYWLMNVQIERIFMSEQMTDRELLELAAKAAGLNAVCFDTNRNALKINGGSPSRWNPLTDDGDALRLANKLNLYVLHHRESVAAQWGMGKPYREKCEDETRDEATRRAITRAAAEIGKAMK